MPIPLVSPQDLLNVVLLVHLLQLFQKCWISFRIEFVHSLIGKFYFILFILVKMITYQSRREYNYCSIKASIIITLMLSLRWRITRQLDNIIFTAYKYCWGKCEYTSIGNCSPNWASPCLLDAGRIASSKMLLLLLKLSNQTI